MPKLLHIAITSAAALLSVGGTRRPDAPASTPPVIREIADASLRDVAVAVYDSAHPVIYYNPALMERLGPDLETFFLAHERAHIELRHTRASALRAEASKRDSLLQSKELEADCLAAQRLGRDHRQAALAAAHFFARLGSMHYDDEHPAGAIRAARILACMP
jgi:hypothetical protein